MVIERKKVIFIRWFAVAVLLLVPLLFVSDFFTNMKTEYLLDQNSIEMSLTFSYGENRKIKCYTENPEDTEGKSYVFLPSFADLDAVGVDIAAGSVTFVNGPNCIEVKAGTRNVYSFESEITYETHFYDTNDKEVGSKSIIFMKSANLPTLYVNTRTGNMDRLDADKKYKEKAFIEFVNADGTILYADDLRSISSRGNQTFTFEKKSYQINLKNSVDFLKMGASDTWILLCNVYDPSYVRNKLVYDMALQAGMPGSPKSEYIDVYFNGIYSGMYLLSEKIEIGDNRIEIADLEQENRALNGEVLDYVDTFDNWKGKGPELAINPQDITGGYLIEHDYGGKFGEVTSGFILDSGEQFALKNPGHASEEEVTYIRNLMQEIEDAIAAKDGINPHTGKHFTEYIDLESWADKYLVEEITRNNGGGTTSSYFYKPKDSMSTKVFGGPVWDYDKGFGREDGYNKNTRDLELMTLHHIDYTNWFFYLYQHEEFVEAVKKEYADKFSSYLTVMADRKTDEYLEGIVGSAKLDCARFGHIYRSFGDTEPDYRKEAEKVKQFIRDRKTFLDEVWLENKPVCMVKFGDENGIGNRCLVVIQGECIETLPDFAQDGSELSGWKIEGTDKFLTTQMPITEDISVRAVWKGETAE